MSKISHIQNLSIDISIRQSQLILTAVEMQNKLTFVDGEKTQPTFVPQPSNTFYRNKTWVSFSSRNKHTQTQHTKNQTLFVKSRA
jgi:hypothetical protein